MRTVYLSCAIALLIYVGAYFGTLRFGVTVHAGGFWCGTPYYTGVPHQFYAVFAPIHTLDRKVLRRNKWAGKDSNGYWKRRAIFRAGAAQTFIRSSEALK